jgi:hypothetical protein
MLQLSPSYSFGIRFNNISITNDTKILDAYIELYSIGTPGHNNPNCKIYCDAVDNAINFTDEIGVLNITGRIYTENYTRWNSTSPYARWVRTPSLVAPLQEIIDRNNWSADNSVAFLFVTEGIRNYSAAYENYESGSPARLYIEYEETD